jgi:hypothetical protein
VSPMQPQLTLPGDLGHSSYAGRSPAANAIGRTDTCFVSSHLHAPASNSPRKEKRSQVGSQGAFGAMGELG